MALTGKQPGLLVAVIVPAFLSTLVVVARSMRKVKRRPSYISKAGTLTAEILLILSVVRSKLLHVSKNACDTDILQISGWVSGVFVILSISHGFGRHENEVLAAPNGMDNLIGAAFWQTTGYCMLQCSPSRNPY